MRNKFSEDIFNQKYAHQGASTWSELAGTLTQDVVGDFVEKFGKDDYKALQKAIDEMKFIPGGRYLYYAGRKNKYYNNCFLLSGTADTRQNWADIAEKSTSCLTTGGGIGVDYSIYRAEGSVLKGTGGIASGPLSLMNMVNEIGRNVMQGGSRRSAIYASLNWKHGDVDKFLKAKDWHNVPVGTTGLSFKDIKDQDFNFPAALDMTNISVNYDTKWLMDYWKTGDVGSVFMENAKQALSTGEPGFSFNFFGKEKETLRNA